MKNLVLFSTALLLSTSAFNASATTFKFDPDQDTTFIDVDVLTTDLFPNDPILLTQDFGADNLLNNGDTFSESFTYNRTSSTGDPDLIFPNPPNGLDFALTLTGAIGNVVYSAGVPDLNNLPNLGAALDGTSFDTLFNTSAVDASVAMTVSYNLTVIGEFDVVAQTASPNVSLDGTTQNSAFIFDFKFDQAWAAANSALIDSVWKNQNGTSIDITSFVLEGKGSAGPNGTLVSLDPNGGSNGNIVLEVADNGAAFTAKVPEPTSLAILGLGLLGLAGARRRA